MKTLTVDVHLLEPSGYEIEIIAARIELPEDIVNRITSMTSLCQTGEVESCTISNRLPVWLEGLYEGEDYYVEGFKESNASIVSCILTVYSDGEFCWRAYEKHSEVGFETSLMCLSDFKEN